MVIDMDEKKLCSIAQLSEFLAGTLEVDFTGIDGSDAQRYAHISRVLKRFGYPQLGKGDRGVRISSRLILRCSSKILASVQ